MNSYFVEARKTLSLALPIIVGQVSQMLMGVTDSLMIGRVGTVPLAAAAFANSIWGVFFIFAIGLLIPVAVLVARAHGAGREAEGGEWLRHGVVIAWAVGAMQMLGMLLLGTQLHRLGQPPEVVAAAYIYFVLIAMSLVPSLLFQTFRQFAESLGRPWVPMALMLAGVLLNVFLNWILIYGHLGLPAFGLAGAGWATLIARVIGIGAIFWWLRRSPAFRVAWPVRWWRGLEWVRFREMASLGVPAAVSLLFESCAFAAAALMMGWISATALAAHQIALSCAAFAFMFPLGLSMAVSMRVGRAVGEGRTQALRAIGFSAQGLSAAIMGVSASIFALGAQPIAEFFVTDPDVVALASKLLVVAAIFQLTDGGQVVGAGVLRGLADVKVPTLITCLAYWGVALPAGYFLGVRGEWGALGIWASLAAGLTLAAVLLIWRFARLTRRLQLA